MTTVMVTQPVYWPPTWWLNRALHANTIVLLDSAQFARRHSGPTGKGPTWQNCCEYRTATGRGTLTVPVGRSRAPICETPIDVDGGTWRATHRDTLRHNYGKAPYWSHYGPFVAWLVDNESPASAGVHQISLGALTVATTVMALQWAGFEGLILQTSKPHLQDLDATGSDWMLDIAIDVEATRYLAGATAIANYLDAEAFERAGVELVAHRYDPVPYDQRHDGFEPNLSCLDAFFNIGPAAEAVLAGVEP